MILEKPTRIVDAKLLESIRELPCIACGLTGNVHAHHVTSKGAGGDDVWTNVMPLCALHHGLWHSQGPQWMTMKYPSVLYWLELAERTDVIERMKK